MNIIYLHPFQPGMEGHFVSPEVLEKYGDVVPLSLQECEGYVLRIPTESDKRSPEE